jgi:hypothetical protein
LFTPSRTAPTVDAPVVEEEVVAAPVEPPPDPEEPPPPIELIGIVLAGANETAIIRNPITDEILRLASGEEIENWALKIVDARSIELRRGDRVHELKMFESFPAPPPPSPIATGEPYDENMPPEMMNGEQFEQIPPDDQQQMPSDPFVEPMDAQSSEGQPTETGTVPDQEFAPELGIVPIPEEGAPSPEGEQGANQ